jgi:HK97 family phage prohead protease
MEHKQVEATIINLDEEAGIVEAVWAVMGNVDEGGDVIHLGAFTKTFNERGNQIQLLDNHRTDSVMSSLGTVLELRELPKQQLPPELLNNPDVVGGAWGKFQFLLDTPEGKGAFTRIKKRAVKKWSFGYDAVDKDMSKRGDKIVRNLRGIKLYEISPVLFAMNEATTTIDAKALPGEGKPYGVIPEGDEFSVYKLDADGEPTGKPLGSHPTRAEAQAQIRALSANEGEGKAGRVLNARMGKRIMDAMALLHDALKEAGLMEVPEDDVPPKTDKPTGPQKSTEPPTPNGAGPNEAERTRLLQLIEVERQALLL